MSGQIINILQHENARLRVVIFQRRDGTFGFEEQKLSDDPLERCWIPAGQYSECVCQSLQQV